MTPVILEILLHYYYSPEGYKGRNSCAENDSISFLYNEGLIIYNKSSNYIISDRGRAYVEHLLKQPLPEPITRWEIPKQ